MVVWTLFVAWPYMRWTQRRINATANAMESVQKFVESELVPLARDARAMIVGAQTIVDDLKSQNPKRILEFIDRLERDGTIHKLTASIEQIVTKFKSDGLGESGKTREQIVKEAGLLDPGPGDF
jgi:hypothetical protein